MKQKIKTNMKTASKTLLLAVALIGSATQSYAQFWDGSPGIQTFTTTSNVGIGLGPVTDARLKIRNTFNNMPGAGPLDIVPGFMIQRDLYWPLSLNSPVANIMEVWKQDYNSVPGGPPGPNQLRYVIDGEGNVGVGKQPVKQLDVSKDANVDGILDVGNVAGSSSSVDALVVHGNITFTRPLDTHYRNLRARTSAGALAFYANAGGEDGPTITMNGITNTTSGTPGGIAFSAVGAGAAPAYDFNCFDPSSNSWNTRMRISANGKVAIGPTTMATPYGYRLFVKDGILTEKIKVALSSDPTNWADFVFADDYKLRPLKEVESYIAKHKHLPEIPSTAEVHQEGLDLAQMDAKLLQKIEELTLYIIEQQKRIEKLESSAKK